MTAWRKRLFTRKAARKSTLLLAAMAMLAAVMTLAAPTASAAPGDPGEGIPPTTFDNHDNIPANGTCGAGGLGTYLKFTTGGSGTVTNADMTSTSSHPGGPYSGTYSFDDDLDEFQINTLVDGNGNPVLFDEIVVGQASLNPSWDLALGTAPTPWLSIGNKNLSQVAVCVIAASVLELTKTLDPADGGTFTFDIVCTGTDGVTVATFDDFSMTLVAGEVSQTATVSTLIPVGATCTVTEDTHPTYVPDGAPSVTLINPDGSNGTFGVTINNTLPGGDLTLVKTVTTDNGGTADAGNWTLTADDGAGNTISGAGGATGTVLAGNYTLSEDGGPAGYAASLWSCEDANGPVDAPDGVVTVSAGDNITCTINNDDIAPTLTLVKTYTNDDGGAITDPAAAGLMVDGVAVTSGTATAVAAGGVITATEAGVAGYAAGTWTGDCAPDGTITLVLGQNATCTVNNDDIAPTLTLVKTYTNNDGGTVTDPAAAGLMVDGVGVTSGTATTVAAGGVITASEDGVDGYLAGDWTGDCAADGTITLALGEDATCTINNDDIAPTLTITKVVDNTPGGGTAVATEWILTASGGPTSGSTLSGAGGASGAVTAGAVYTLAESVGPDGYDASSWTCDGGTLVDDQITLALGDAVACTITNTADGPASIDVSKTANPTQIVEPGDPVTFTFSVTNTSTNDSVTINSLLDSVYGDLTDSVALPGTTCVTGTVLAPTEIYTCSITVTVAGNFGDTHENTLTVEATGDDGDELVDTDTATVDILDDPSMITITKNASVTSLPEPGGPVTFNFVVTNNSGADTVTINSLIDSVYGDITNLTNLPGTTCSVPQVMAPSDVYTCSFTVVIDDNAGFVETNVVTATGTDDDGQTVGDTDDETVTLTDVESSILVTKSANLAEVPASGADVEFTVTVENTSVADVVTITSVVDDVFGDVGASCLPALPADLAPGATLECVFVEFISGDHTVDHENVVTATGVDDDDVPVEDDDNEEIDILEVALETEKTFVEWIDTDLSLTATSGDILVYNIVVTNTGEAPLTDMTVEDDLTGDAIVCVGTTAVGATCELLGIEYPLEQADIDAGLVENTGTGDSEETPPDDSVVEVPLEQMPLMEVSKTFTGQTNNGDDENVIEVGDFLNYDIIATNTGNVTLTDVLVSDDLTGTVDALCSAALAPTERCTVQVIYIEVTQGDIDASVVLNEATITAQPPGDDDPIEDTATEEVPIEPTPGIELVKTGALVVAEDGFPVPGDTIEWTFEITNVGNITLVRVELEDDLDGLSGLVCDWNGAATALADVGPLGIGATVICTATSTLTQAHIDAGSLENVALATGEIPPIDNPPDNPTDSGDDTVLVPAIPFIELVKTANPATGVQVGDTVTYTLIGTNSGNVTLTDVEISDPLIEESATALACSWPGEGAALAPGEQVTCVGDYVVLQGDVVNGEVINVASARGIPPAGEVVEDIAQLPVPVVPPSVVTTFAPPLAVAVPPVAPPLALPDPPVVEPDEVLGEVVLAITGADSRILLSAALMLMGTGSLMLLGARRRRKDEDN